MSGTSADGIDAVLAEVRGSGPAIRARLLAWVHRPFQKKLRRRVLAACFRGSTAEVCELNFLLGGHFARAALAVMRKAGCPPGRIAVIGSHGQTIHHLPGGRPPSTLQVGEPAVIAERTGIPTIADFRVADMAAGGQGAPLVPFADWVLLRDGTRPRIVQNLGGIANLTFLPPGAGLESVTAFDTGPGNLLLDGAVRELSGGRRAMDREGRMAARGRVSEGLLRELLRHPFLRRRPPKTTGREAFGEAYLQEVLRAARKLRLDGPDLLATLTEYTAVTIAEACHRFVFPRLAPVGKRLLQMIVGGGGARNPSLLARLRFHLAGVEILTHADFGIPDQAKEALAFALLARETLHGRPSNVPSATGARHPVVLGKLIAVPDSSPHHDPRSF